MGQVGKPLPAKLVIGLIYRNNIAKIQTIALLEKKYGGIDFISDELDFGYTDYYRPEMGDCLKRLFISFRKLKRPDELAGIKIFTNKLEKLFSRNYRRLINIDPGFLNASKLILATTKDYSHRIYLSKGIFVEVTLIYRGKSFEPLDWTYPDYKSKEYIEIFHAIRKIYCEQARSHRHCEEPSLGISVTKQSRF